jgi:hypothetical protein
MNGDLVAKAYHRSTTSRARTGEPPSVGRREELLANAGQIASLAEEASELLARESPSLLHPAGSLGDRDLKDGLGQIHRDRRTLHVDSSFPKRFGGQGDSCPLGGARGRAEIILREPATPCPTLPT